ncbi:MAG: hypothetical protein HYW63_02780 [Candidatus Levybacteria bacterium]|nr:hypothetical protein [Candidatus Levybacteria bacterium]
MSKDERKFQKAFLLQVKATLKGNFIEATRARARVNFYRKKLDERN